MGQVKLVRIASLGQIHKVVSDDLLPAEAVEALQAVGVEVITPERLAIRKVDDEKKETA